MGWRADQAYEQAQREDFLQWRRSLTWREYLAWETRRHAPFLAGAASMAVIILLVLH